MVRGFYMKPRRGDRTMVSLDQARASGHELITYNDLPTPAVGKWPYLSKRVFMRVPEGKFTFLKEVSATPTLDMVKRGLQKGRSCHD